MSICPSDETLARLGHESPDLAEWSAVEAHVQQCEKCVGSLEKLLSHETAPAPAPASLPAGEKLPRIPGFDIKEELGRGGMGVVYRAWEPTLARTVALKIVPSGPRTGSRERKHWLAEARYATRVRHPDIVQIHEAGEADGWLYLVLEFVPGGSLKERLRGPLPPQAAADLMRPVATAMAAVHEAGLLHLDLKPSNILLDSAPEAPWQNAAPKVGDFGVARSPADRDASATSLAGPWGTPSYMAPEQATGARAGVGMAADIHALGAILYELLTGCPPYEGASTLETLDQVRGQKPVPPRRLNPKIPRDLETIALKCLEKNPSRRYPSAEALAADLNRFLEGRPIKARPVPPIEHAWRWCRRQPAIAALAGALLLTLLGSYLGLLALLRRSETQRSRSEANYQVASKSLDELLRILSSEHLDNPLKPPRDSVNALELARSQEMELSKRYPLDLGCLKRLTTIDTYLADFYERVGKRDEARSLTEESIGCCEALLAICPGDMDVQERWFGAVGGMLVKLSDSENDPLYEQWNARVIAMLERLSSLHEVRVDWMSGVSHCHLRRADYLMMRGDLDHARRELEADLDLVRSVSVAETAFPGLDLDEALTLAALGQWSGKLTPPQCALDQRPPIVDIDRLERRLAELAARRIGWLPSVARSPWLIPEDLPAEAWTDRVISSIKSDAAIFHRDHTRIPAIGWMMMHHSSITMTWQRKVGKLSDAHRIADQLVALAERLTRSYPDQAASFMLLSEGYVQQAKIAYRVDGAPVDGWERKALDAAVQAERLEPENEQASSLVKERRGRLAKLASK